MLFRSWNRHPYWESFPIGNMSEYIRSDIVEEMREALERLVATGLDQYTHHQIMSDPSHYVNAALKRLEEV